ncbi:3-demethylubiquinone-9 3-O-methyltransferase [Babesia bovis T2Bo]|uniref:3-demethylubiquinone-9 3-O-methyltransferase n=1 Tax=Babesia bovis T2Bo TaxID=484906 RepID=UPI001C362EEA|nr:3-demethylubiquinone-9 3-O-methyltransferase [Babesia bovis T2Bo]EDO06694.2 3-demethylubiquinone-9 3-O-methyltransferase [Babesia bovis T2Bo]
MRQIGTLSLTRFYNIAFRQPRHFSSNAKFGPLGNDWWDIDGPVSVLHDYNYVRVPFIARSYANLNGQEDNHTNVPQLGTFIWDCIFKEAEKRSKVHLSSILNGVRILDVGCGGGILSEILAKCGAHVVGIDPSKELIEVAKQHRDTDLVYDCAKLGLSDECSRNLEYIQGTVESYAQSHHKELFDIVVASEVIEHVPNIQKQAFIDSIARLTKPGGLVVFTTPGRSLKSCVINIGFAERVFKTVPKDTHRYTLFVSPESLSRSCANSGLSELCRQGIFYLPYIRRFVHVNTCDILYMIAYKRDI